VSMEESLVQPTTVSEKLKLLLVENQPISADAYAHILAKASRNKKLPPINIRKAASLKSAYDILVGDNWNFDIVILKIDMVAFPEQNVYSGEELGILIRRHRPETKIIVFSAIQDRHRIGGILVALRATGYLLKSEATATVLVEAVQCILQEKPFYSPTVQQVIKDQYLSGIILNEEEKKFLYLLSLGMRNKDIVHQLPWSLSKIEKQKRVLKEKLNATNSTGMSLAHRARELRII